MGLLELTPRAAAWAALLCTAPLLIAAAVWDLRRMRIPNWLNGGLALIFLAFGLASLPLEEVAWRAAGGLLVLVVGFGFFSLGRMGGGDVKMLAACALYVPLHHAGLVLQMLALALALGLAAIHIARAALGGRETSWRSLRKGARFPMGLSIAAAMLGYFGFIAAMTA
ncbi:prepilin peptidase [Albimonas sp. CAU 1670]|uniref:A24 family peptidase n=1 Tax=Albimonas sp. CAU 1670 TaxID=3032599 RepID=UPI0023DC5AF9|nr:prepilin peptidase [Albimonas sp. CAU 1670]MDF2234430.1 prepilin peptidase [Albimonas sp. CAU 1670]